MCEAATRGMCGGCVCMPAAVGEGQQGFLAHPRQRSRASGSSISPAARNPVYHMHGQRLGHDVAPIAAALCAQKRRLTPHLCEALENQIFLEPSESLDSQRDYGNLKSQMI